MSINARVHATCCVVPLAFMASCHLYDNCSMFSWIAVRKNILSLHGHKLVIHGASVNNRAAADAPGLQWIAYDEVMLMGQMYARTLCCVCVPLMCSCYDIATGLSVQQMCSFDICCASVSVAGTVWSCDRLGQHSTRSWRARRFG